MNRQPNSSQPLKNCGCCEGATAQTPAAIENAAGLPAIDYRVGTHSRFKESMIARLSASDFPELAGLRTRDDDDFSIALLDAWAMVADVLTFYQERIANESYLRTATERRSLVEQARLIGYQIRPGVAATAMLAFQLDDAVGSPPEVTIPAGTKVQSVPKQNEMPQVFETSQDLVARVDLNGLAPVVTEGPVSPADLPQAPDSGDPGNPPDLDDPALVTEMWFRGAALNLKAGAMLVVSTPTDAVFNTFQPSLWRVKSVQVDNEHDRTKVDIEPRSLPSDATDAATFDQPGVWVMRVKAAPFGHNAPLQSQVLDPPSKVGGCEWRIGDREAADGTLLTLDVVYDEIETGSLVVIDRPVQLPTAATSSSCPTPPQRSAQQARRRIFARAVSVRTTSRADYGISGRATELTLTPRWLSDTDLADETLLSGLRGVIVYAQGEVLERVEVPVTTPLKTNPSITFAGPPVVLAEEQSILVQGKRMRARVGEAVTGLVLTSDDDPGQSKTLAPGDQLIVAAPVAELAGPIPNQRRWPLMDAGGFLGSVVATGSQIVFAPSAEEDEVVAELARIKTVDFENPGAANSKTKISLAENMANVFDPNTVSVNANVVAATHGQTQHEVLGSGDSSRSFQSFVLKQSPLTYVPAASVAGSASTLEVRVNDVLWREAPTLLNRLADERIFVTRTDDDGSTTVQFGDGRSGARLPSGQENVRAVYRKGIGTGGLVEAGQLSLLLDRPLGLKDVTNPLPAHGGEDPESLDDARENIPTATLTLDRAVSLQDYEDFARTFAGVDKSLATFTGRGRQRGIFLTVAGVDGAEVAAESIGLLIDALRAAGDPFVPIEVQTFQAADFRFAARVQVEPDYLAELVIENIRVALRQEFGFDSRRLGQPVFASELIRTIQATPGVLAVDLDLLHRTGNTPELKDRLLADVPIAGSQPPLQAAELLTLDPSSLDDLQVIR